MTKEQIQVNAQTYYQQAAMVLDPEKTEIRYNSEWSEPLGARGMIELSAKYTVARMMERDDFHKRFHGGESISVHEFLYPLMQGYDSVALHADLELGGTDQKFNLLMGRHLQQEYGQEPQCILTMPLLEGLDGVDKMSKSKNNYIGISEDANTMFAKVLSISDVLMWRWFTLLSFRSEAEIAGIQAQVANGMNPGMPRSCWQKKSRHVSTTPLRQMPPSKTSLIGARGVSPTTFQRACYKVRPWALAPC